MGLRTYASCEGLVLCCGQDGYLPQVSQHPIGTNLKDKLHNNNSFTYFNSDH